jgi:hypothetical protein
MKNYYERKVAEGKPKLMVLNAVRNKLISRVVAIVKRETSYFYFNKVRLYGSL